MEAASGRRIAIRDHPVLVPTSKGPAGAIVSEPEGTARAALLLFQGGGPPARCGVNAIWTRIARRLAGLGMVVLRFDFGCEADSAPIGAGAERGPAWRSAVDLPLTHEVSDWFHERVGAGILMAGSCYGARLALEVAVEKPWVDGVFLVTPYLAGVRRKRAAPPDNAAAKAMAELPNPPQNQNDRLSAVAIDSSRALAERGTPLWMLIGERDAPHALELQQRVRTEAGGPEVEVAPGIALHPGNDPASQKAIADRMSERVADALRRR